VIALAEKPRRFSKKMIIALVFIVLFTVSVAAVFLYPSPVTEEDVGYVNVSRSESYWENTLGNVTEARYLINYGIYVISDAPKATITDKTDAHLTQIELEQDTSNVQVSYDASTGTITVVATEMAAGDKVFAQLAFKIDPVDVFVPGEEVSTTVTPNDVYWGDKTSVNVTISPFAIAKTTNMTEVGVYTWLTDAVAEITNASITPDGECEAPMYQAIWQYTTSPATSYGAHTVVYGIKLPTTVGTGDVLLRTWVEVRYSNPLRMKIDGTIKGVDGLFFKVDSSISYQYEHPLLTRQVG
jgi:hypothetical protein